MRVPLIGGAVLLLAWASTFEHLRLHPGKWHAWGRETNMLGASGATKNARQIVAACGEVGRIQAVFGRAKALDPPVGANVRRSCGFHGTSFDGRFPVAYNLGMIFKDLYRMCPTCPVEEAAEGPSIWVYVNTIGPLISQNLKFQDRYLDEPYIFPEPRVAAEQQLGGFPLYQGDFGLKWIVIAREGRPSMWKPVSKEGALTRLIETLERIVEKRRPAFRNRPEEFERVLWQELQVLADARAELTALSPVDRERQAWLGCPLTKEMVTKGRPPLLCDGEPHDKPNVLRYVEANEEFWDRSLAPTQPQLIVMDLLTTDAEPRKSEYQRRRRQAIVDTLDWKALGEIVNPR